MKMIATVLAAATLALAASSAHASDEARFERLVRKSVPRYGDQFSAFAPKTACICDPQGNKTPGALLADADFVACMIPQFAGGKLMSLQACGSTYVVLGR